jgi:hypothetical protein
VACLPNEVALKLLKMVEAQSKDAPKVSKEVQQLVDDKKAKAEEKAKAKFEQGWRDMLLKDTWHAVKAESRTTFSIAIHRYLVTRAAKSLSTDNAEAICKILDLGKVSPISALVDHAKETERPDQLHMLIIMQEASSANDYSHTGTKNEGLMLIAENTFDDVLDSLIQEIKLDVKAQVWPEKTKAPIPLAPAAQAKGGRGGAKGQKGKGQKPPAGASAQRAHLNAEEARQGIADALQGNETPDAARRSGDITGACAQGDEVGPAARPDGAADTVAVNHAGADENTAPGVQAGAPIAAPEPHQAQVVNQAPRATAKGAKTAKPAADIKRSDALLEDAVELVTTQQAVSVRQIKTEFSVGTARAMRIIDELERDGVVSATDERGARKVLVAA